MPEQPNDPMTSLAMGATATHEMFRAYVDAGFSEDQALQITIALLVANVQQQK